MDPASQGMTDSVRAMLQARSVAIVGASPRQGSFGSRLIHEVTRSSARPDVHLVNPRYDQIEGLRCVPTLDDLDEPVDLVLLGVPDNALEEQLTRAAKRGDRSAVVYGSVVEESVAGQLHLKQRLSAIARQWNMAVCGGGCMGFVNIDYGLRAIGYVEQDTLPDGPVALVTHSGSAFSALLRSHRRFGFTLAVSSGQELVTTTADYLHYALDLPATRVVALLQETMRDPLRLRAALERAADADIPIVALTVGGSPVGREMVAAHSGAIAGDDAAWEALFDAYGVLRVGDLDEMADTLELFTTGRRVQTGSGIATAHDSGAERTLVADQAHQLHVPFAQLSLETQAVLSELIEPGLLPTNPLDVWGTGADTRTLFTGCLNALAGDPEVSVLALSIDLVTEYDGDDSYPLAALDVARLTEKPFAVLSNMHSSVDRSLATWLRSEGIPVLEGTRSGLLAMRHLLEHRDNQARWAAEGGAANLHRTHAGRPSSEKWRERLAAVALASAAAGGGGLAAVESFELLADYGIPVVGVIAADSRAGALAAANGLGWPVVLKTDEPGIAHKSDVGGVVLGLSTADDLAAAYDDLAERLGPRVLVSGTAPPGLELALGIVRDPLLGPLVVVAAGGVLIELLADRAVGLPPLSPTTARRLIDRLTIRPLLDGLRGAPAIDAAAVVAAVVGLSLLAHDLGDQLDALDLNPLIASPSGAVAVDALIILRSPEGAR
jgi:acyl-CoA synthetase (NDP forming)